MTTDRHYRDLARWRYSRANGDIEITNNAQVTPVGDAGAFVAAWVWVPKASPAKLQVRLQRSATRGILFIGEWMEAMGFDTDQKLADKMGGTTRETVELWRTGKRRPPIEATARIAAAMGIEPEHLWRKPPGDYLL
jgi:hypothetical protein